LVKNIDDKKIIEEIEKKCLEFEKLIPNDLIIYGHDYLANDLCYKIKNSIQSTHPRYSPTYQYINDLEKLKYLELFYLIF
jgi:hypothetical protein